MNQLRVGLAGAGFVSGFHLAAWRRVANASVVAICDPNIERAWQQAAKFDVPAAYATIEEMLLHEAPDALDIATPRETHTDLVRKAYAARTPTLCQKPLAPSLAEALALAANIGPGFRLMVHENWRFRPHYRRIQGWLARTQPDLPGETAATLVFEAAEGVPVVLEINMAVQGFPPVVSDRFELLGDHGAIICDGDTVQLLGALPKQHRYDPGAAIQEGYFGAISHFVNCLRSGHEFETSLPDNLETLKLVESAYRFAESDQLGRD